MGSIDSTAVATALPLLSRDLNASIAWTTWTISAYQLGSVTATPVAGRLSDALGRKRTFMGFALLFTCASLLCGLVSNIYLLLALRFVQAIGGGGLVPSATGVIADQFGRDRDRPIGLMSSIFPLGAIIGPAIGGLIVTYFSWRLIFFVNVPVGIGLLLLLMRVLPPDASPRRSARTIDVASSVLMVATLLSLMLGLNLLGQNSLASWSPWALLVLAVVVGAAFALRQGRISNPLLSLDLFKTRAFAYVNGLNVVYGAAALGIFSLVPIYAQLVFGMTPLAAGELLTVRAGAMAVVSAITSLFILRRFSYRVSMAAGLVLLVAGLAMLALMPSSISPWVWLNLACLVCGIGIGVAGPPSNNAALQLMPSQIAAITGLRAMFRQTGGIIAISLTAAAIAGSEKGVHILPVAFLSLAVLTVCALPAVRGVPANPTRPSRPSQPPPAIPPQPAVSEGR